MHVINSAKLLCPVLVLTFLGTSISTVSGLSLEVLLALNVSFCLIFIKSCGRTQHSLQTLCLPLAAYKVSSMLCHKIIFVSYLPETCYLIYFNNDHQYLSSKDESFL